MIIVQMFPPGLIYAIAPCLPGIERCSDFYIFICLYTTAPYKDEASFEYFHLTHAKIEDKTWYRYALQLDNDPILWHPFRRLG